MPIGPSQQYLAKYNNFVLPGYVQSESLDSAMNIAMHTAPYADGAISEYTGLENKDLTIRLKVWEPDYLSVKDAIETAATYLRSNRSGYAPLYLQYSNRYYDAMVASVRYNKDAGTSVRTGEYEVNFKCRPWLINSASDSISNGAMWGDPPVFDTDGASVPRTIENGGWTPATVYLRGTNPTVSGYTEYGDFTGFISVSGVYSDNMLDPDFIVDTENFTATYSGVNMNHAMKNVDYQLYVGPGKTYFHCTGVTNITISWHDRWYL